MSFDLIIWKTPAVTTEEEASSVVARFRESDDLRVYGASEDVLRFYDEVLQRYPALESFTDDESRRVQSPWSVTPDRSDRVIELNMRWGTPDATLDAIVDLARKYDLVLYDPQGPDLHSPEREAEPADVAGQVRQALIAGAFGLLLVFAGSLVPWRILGWPVIGVGLFLVVMTVYTLVVLWKPEWQPRE